MVDLKKEIKLSDLVPRRKPKAGGGQTLASSGARSRKSGKRELVGLKVGASQVAAARVMNNGSANLVQLRADSAGSRSRRRRRATRCAGAGADTRQLLRGAQAAAAWGSPWAFDESDRRSRLRRRRDRRRPAARERDPVPGSRGRLDSDRRSRARLPRGQRNAGRDGRRLAADRPGRGLPRVDRPLSRGLQGGRDRALRDRPRGVRAAARRRHGSGRLR